jgi:hypothetical protein
MTQLQNTKSAATGEGKWEVKFIFGGKLYTKSHQLSSSEVKHMKDLCVEFGDQAASQIIWRAAIKGVSMVSEALIATAGKDYVDKHYTGPKGPAAGETAATYDTLAAMEAYVESKKPLSDEQAFSEEAAAQIEQEQTGEQL